MDVIIVDFCSWLRYNNIMKTQIQNYTVESWWSSDHRYWITQILDSEGNQVGDADYSPNKNAMKFVHEFNVKLCKGKLDVHPT